MENQILDIWPSFLFFWAILISVWWMSLFLIWSIIRRRYMWDGLPSRISMFRPSLLDFLYNKWICGILYMILIHVLGSITLWVGISVKWIGYCSPRITLPPPPWLRNCSSTLTFRTLRVFLYIFGASILIPTRINLSLIHHLKHETRNL